jgi:inhibitor of KinA
VTPAFERRIEVASDQAILVRLGDTIDEVTHGFVVSALAALESERPVWVLDLVPAYATLLVLFDPAEVGHTEAAAWVTRRLSTTTATRVQTRNVTVPVCYDGELGLDLEELARELRADINEVIAWHSAPTYLVYMLGFKPGFPYMGTLDDRLTVPRLATPRTAVPAGSVAIAGRQTGIYPVPSPGGWRILGRTPVAVFDPDRAAPFLLRPGDRVRFEPIARARFNELVAQESER